MSLETAAKIGARRCGADMRLVDARGLADLAERTALAFQALTNAPLATTRELVRLELMADDKHPSYYEVPIDEHGWFEVFWANVKYPQILALKRRRALRVIPGGGQARRRSRRQQRLELVQGGAE